MAFEFTVVEIHEAIERKINGRHHVSVDDVLDALDNATNAIWDDHPQRGRRLYVRGRVGERVVVVVLYPIDMDAGEWRLATAYVGV